MPDPRLIDDITRRIGDALPGAARILQADLEKNLRAAVQAALSKLDLVSREEFDVQAKVLARSRARIEQLERQVAELEQTLGICPPKD
ncbi:MAG TPA: accessory factor UbiK family protein [Gammaproteobacteria bacterium]|nr:accessory factor UbiK family protein [Gammaproteobacteria bacterium]